MPSDRSRAQATRRLDPSSESSRKAARAVEGYEDARQRTCISLGGRAFGADEKERLRPHLRLDRVVCDDGRAEKITARGRSRCGIDHVMSFDAVAPPPAAVASRGRDRTARQLERQRSVT